MRRLTRPVLVTTVCLFLMSCQRDASNPAQTEEKTQFSGDGFSLSHARTISIVKEPAVHDFDVYRFSYQGWPILSVYVGNHPDFKYESQPVSTRSKGLINGLRCARVQILGGDGPVYTDVLVEFPNDRLWPRYIHFWYTRLPPDLRGTVEDIISSLKAQEAGSEPIPPGVTLADSTEFPPQKPTWQKFEKRLHEMQESIKAAQEAGKEVDPNIVGQVEQMEQMLKRAKERGEY